MEKHTVTAEEAQQQLAQLCAAPEQRPAAPAPVAAPAGAAGSVQVTAPATLCKVVAVKASG